MKTLRSYGPGKFNLILDAFVYEVSLVGGTDAEEGSVSEIGTWAGLMRHGHTIFKDGDPFNENSGLTPDEIEYLSECAGCIIYEDAQGFVTVSYFDEMQALDEAWDEVSSDLFLAMAEVEL